MKTWFKKNIILISIISVSVLGLCGLIAGVYAIVIGTYGQKLPVSEPTINENPKDKIYKMTTDKNVIYNEMGWLNPNLPKPDITYYSANGSNFIDIEIADSLEILRTLFDGLSNFIYGFGQIDGAIKNSNLTLVIVDENNPKIGNMVDQRLFYSMNKKLTSYYFATFIDNITMNLNIKYCIENIK